MAQLFLIRPTGDPYNRTGWDVLEFQHSYADSHCTFRGDLSPVQGRERTRRLLKRLYPGCNVRVER